MVKKAAVYLCPLVRAYQMRKIGHTSAALGFYLTLSVFPALICLNAFLGSMQITQGEINSLGQGILSEGMLEFIGEYISYVNTSGSPFMLAAAVTLLVTSSTGGFGVLMRGMSRIQGEGRFHGFWSLAACFLLSIAFLAVLYVSCAVIFAGQWILRVLDDFLSISIYVRVWKYVRFGLLFLLLYGVIQGIYWITQPKGRKCRRWPGALISAGLLVVISIGFSVVMSYSVRYTLVYGSLASMILLMLWLRICAQILFSGAFLNAEVFTKKEVD